MYGKFWQRIVKSLHAHTHTHQCICIFHTDIFMLVYAYNHWNNDNVKWYIYICIFVDYDGMYIYIYIYISFHWCMYSIYTYTNMQRTLVHNVSLSLRKLYPPFPFSFFRLDFPCYWEMAGKWRPYDNPYDVGMYRNICAVLGSSPLVWYLDTLNNGEFVRRYTPRSLTAKTPESHGGWNITFL